MSVDCMVNGSPWKLLGWEGDDWDPFGSSLGNRLKCDRSKCLLNSVISFCFLTAVFKPEELRQALMPTLEALYRQDPESLPFRQPVDPQLLGIPVS